jgi:hypothetical protein
MDAGQRPLFARASETNASRRLSRVKTSEFHIGGDLPKKRQVYIEYQGLNFEQKEKVQQLRQN